MTIVEERAKTVADIVRSEEYTILHKPYYFPDISEKALAKITKEFDPHINVSHIAAIIDTTLAGSAKNGTVFTITGFYDRELFEKPFYINYADITAYHIEPDKKGRVEGTYGKLIIDLDDGNQYTTTNDAEVLMRILNKLIPVVMTWNDEYNHKEPGIIGKYGLTESQLTKCHAIIHAASVAAGGVGTGLAQIPLADTALITPIQLAMITGLGGVFEINVSESAAKGIIGSVMAAVVGRYVSQLLAGWIPGVGNALNTATAAGITELIGWVAVKHFVDTNEEDRAKFRTEGMKAGYEAASDEYEAKLRNQADAFIKQEHYAEAQCDAYEKLLDEYENYIRVLKKQIEVLKQADGLEVPRSLANNYAEMTDKLAALRKLKECS